MSESKKIDILIKMNLITGTGPLGGFTIVADPIGPSRTGRVATRNPNSSLIVALCNRLPVMKDHPNNR